jgi:hypothetical protein
MSRLLVLTFSAYVTSKRFSNFSSGPVATVVPWLLLLTAEMRGRAGFPRGLGSLASWVWFRGLLSSGVGGSRGGRGYKDGGKMPGKPGVSVGKAGGAAEKGRLPGCGLEGKYSLKPRPLWLRVGEGFVLSIMGLGVKGRPGAKTPPAV